MFFVREQSTDQPCRQIVPLQASDLEAWVDSAPPAAKAWVRAHEFEAEPGSSLVVPDEAGNPSTVLIGFAPDAPTWALAGLPAILPAGDYAVTGDFSDRTLSLLATGWALGHYRFDRYKPGTRPACKLEVPEHLRERLEIYRDAMFRVRDLVNTPAADLGPEELAEVAADLAERCEAVFSEVTGAELEKEFPADSRRRPGIQPRAAADSSWSGATRRIRRWRWSARA